MSPTRPAMGGETLGKSRSGVRLNGYQSATRRHLKPASYRSHLPAIGQRAPSTSRQKCLALQPSGSASALQHCCHHARRGPHSCDRPLLATPISPGRLTWLCVFGATLPRAPPRLDFVAGSSGWAPKDHSKVMRHNPRTMYRKCLVECLLMLWAGKTAFRRGQPPDKEIDDA